MLRSCPRQRRSRRPGRQRKRHLHRSGALLAAERDLEHDLLEQADVVVAAKVDAAQYAQRATRGGARLDFN